MADPLTLPGLSEPMQRSASGPAVLNRHHFRGREFPPGSFYVGRPGRLASEIFAEHPELGDLTVLGNPFRAQEHGSAALEFYRRALWNDIKARNPVTIAALDKITAESSLVCSCVLKDGGGKCHAKVIRDAWVWLAGQRSDQSSTTDRKE